VAHHAASGAAAIADVRNFVGGVLLGVASSLAGLWFLFNIKPSLRLTWEEGFPTGNWWKQSPPDQWWRCSRHEPPSDKMPQRKRWASSRWWAEPPPGTWLDQPDPSPAKPCSTCERRAVHYRVEVENLGLAAVVEIKFRAWLIRRKGLATRERIPIKNDQLLELNGKWREALRADDDIERHAGDRFFHVLLPCCVSPDGLGVNDEYLFQAWSKHGVTNFGRVHKLRIKFDPASPDRPFGRLDAEDPSSGRWHVFAPAAAIIANAARYVIHLFRAWRAEAS
jgi:hypothetical protein